MVTNEKETDQHLDSSRALTFHVLGWPNLSINEWKRLGFEVDEILRTIPPNTILRTKPPSLQELPEEDPAFLISGEIYRLDEETARKMAGKVFWVYILGLLLFIAMLQAVWYYHGIVAAIVFIILYLVLETSVPFLFRTSAASLKQNEVKIPWRSLISVGFISRRNTFLLSWKVDKGVLGISFNLNKETALELLERIRNSPYVTCETKLL